MELASRPFADRVRGGRVRRPAPRKNHQQSADVARIVCRRRRTKKRPMSNPFSLENKTILVTGASSGIGRACARECAKAGARIIANGRDATRLEETIEKLGQGAHIDVPADLTEAGGAKNRRRRSRETRRNRALRRHHRATPLRVHVAGPLPKSFRRQFFRACRTFSPAFKGGENFLWCLDRFHFFD